MQSTRRFLHRPDVYLVRLVLVSICMLLGAYAAYITIFRPAPVPTIFDLTSSTIADKLARNDHATYLYLQEQPGAAESKWLHLLEETVPAFPPYPPRYLATARVITIIRDNADAGFLEKLREALELALLAGDRRALINILNEMLGLSSLPSNLTRSELHAAIGALTFMSDPIASMLAYQRARDLDITTPTVLRTLQFFKNTGFLPESTSSKTFDKQKTEGTPEPYRNSVGSAIPIQEPLLLTNLVAPSWRQSAGSVLVFSGSWGRRAVVFAEAEQDTVPVYGFKSNNYPNGFLVKSPSSIPNLVGQNWQTVFHTIDRAGHGPGLVAIQRIRVKTADYPNGLHYFIVYSLDDQRPIEQGTWVWEGDVFFALACTVDLCGPE